MNDELTAHSTAAATATTTTKTSPQSHLRKARRSSAYKKNSKLLNPHSPI